MLERGQACAEGQCGPVKGSTWTACISLTRIHGDIKMSKGAYVDSVDLDQPGLPHTLIWIMVLTGLDGTNNIIRSR